MTSDVTSLLLPAVAGIGAGLFFFGGLWWTVQRLPRARQPGLYTLASFVLRTAGVLALFYLVADGRWQRVLVALAAFIATRVILVRVLAFPAPAPQAQPRESER